MLPALGRGNIIGDPVNPENVRLFSAFNDRFDAVEVTWNFFGMIDSVEV